MDKLQKAIEEGFNNRADITPKNVAKPTKDAVLECISLLDSGSLRVAEKKQGNWIVNEWLKKAVQLYFSIEDNQLISG